MSEKGAEIQPEPEVVKPRFDPKNCKGCGASFIPAYGYVKFCDRCRTDKERKKRSRKRTAEKAAREK